MPSSSTKLSDVSGPPEPPTDRIVTLKNQLLSSIERFPESLALTCFSENEDSLGGLDLSHESNGSLNGPAANGQTNGHVNGINKGHINGHSNGVILNGNTKRPSYLRLTYSQMYNGARRLAAALAARGIKPGDAICTVMYTGVEVSLITWAAFLLGCVWVPLHPRTAANAKELKHVLEIANPVAFVALDGDVAAKLDTDDTCKKAKVKITSTVGSHEGWLPWAELVRDKRPLLQVDYDADKDREGDRVLIVFTSGTTNLPKGCAHTNLSLGKACLSAVGIFKWDNHVSMHHNFPFHHIGGNFPAFSAWIVGANVLLPSPTFSAEKAVQAMRAEPITDITLVPSMLMAMQEHDPTPYKHGRQRFTCTMSATTILREHYLDAKEYFNFTHFVSPYGSSEGLPSLGVRFDASKFHPKPGPIKPGPPANGARIKICAPGERQPLPRNEYGELHQSGDQVIRGYINKDAEEFYVDDEGVAWYASGDAAIMDDDDHVEIVGRLKDMIIRGGVNISPSRIEDLINTLPGIDVSVVAAMDVISGEVPVAVVRFTGLGAPATSVEMRELVIKELGPTFALSEVVTLSDLGLSDWPKTTSGKVRKVELRALVKEFLDKSAVQGNAAGEKSLLETLTEIWSKLLGLPASKLSADADLRDLADSLTTMQFRSQLRKSLGKSLSTQQLLTTYTIADQVKVLNEMQSTSVSKNTLVQRRDGPPTIDDVSFADGDSEAFERIKRAVTTDIAALGFDWDRDVQDLIPLWDWGRLQGKKYRPKSFIHRHAFVHDHMSKDSLRKAFEQTMDVHPLLRTYGIQREDPEDRFLVTLRSSPHFFKQSIHDAGTLDKASDLSTICLETDQINTFFPGLLFRIILADIKETGTAGFVFIAQHATFDAGSMSLFFENFNLITKGQNPVARTAYKPWADMYYNNRTSARASEAVAARARHFHNSSSLRNALWPPTRAPGFFFGNDAGWLDPATMKHGAPVQRPITEPDVNVSTGLAERNLAAPYDQGVTRAFELPGLSRLQRAHGVHPVTLVQNALVLANMHMTRQRTAFLSLANGGRVWPFLQPEVADLLPEPVDVDGPMVQIMPHSVSLPDGISTVDFLKRQQKDQQSLSKYVHAPYFRIVGALSAADGEMFHDVLRRQVFNWLPLIGRGGIPLEGFTCVQRTHHNDFVLTWAAGMAGDQTVVVHADVDQAQMSVAEVQRAQEVLVRAAEWMCDEVNWERDAGEFLNVSF